MEKKSLTLGFLTNLGLLLTGFTTALSGFVIQFAYHMGHHGHIEQSSLALGMDYGGWSHIHKVSIVIISLSAIVHIVLHWKWYKTVVRKKLLGKNRLVLTLTILFVIVALTGYIPWVIDLTGGREETRKGFIEVHDKLTFILLPYLVIHVTRRWRWFISSYKRLKESPGRESRSPKIQEARVKM
ncbi:MAG: hypothetical protein CVU64_08985 [Deltaproteobacteria bacterium HGW-Deltaproteobacteria-21]|nr:MAG: hypothetical protein CVU64_08985 [Deltaproteobacteria bacterium HGW-Deltaproteobacteria-21]